LIHEDPELLSRDVFVLNDESNKARRLLHQINTIEQWNVEMSNEISVERKAVDEYDSGIAVQRIQRVLDLSTSIYPVQVVDRRYLIRGLELTWFDSVMSFSGGGSNDSNSANLSDDDVLAALGYRCHAVYMLSVYLDVHLRYRLLCHSSRSSIVDIHAAVRSTPATNAETLSLFASKATPPPQPQPTTTTPTPTIMVTATDTNTVTVAMPTKTTGVVYPLYQSCGYVSREQLAYAVHLLNCNVDCICKSRSVRVDNPNIHVLAKVLLIYDSIFEGYHFSNVIS
jgi:hypothetical protein